jgi:hypothetical protein
MMTCIICIFVALIISNLAYGFILFDDSARKSVVIEKRLALLKAVEFITHYEEISVPSLKGIHLTDITPQLREIVAKVGLQSGQLTVVSKHTTASVVINEMEGRLVDDIRQFLLKLAPADYPYLHNDLHLRNGPPGRRS